MPRVKGHLRKKKGGGKTRVKGHNRKGGRHKKRR